MISDTISKIHYVLTITLDNGEKFADHVRIARATGADINFAKPYANWQRDTNENINGRYKKMLQTRRNIPKKARASIIQAVHTLELLHYISYP